MRYTLLAATLVLSAQLSWADDWAKHWNISGKPELKVSAGDAAVYVEVGANNAIDARVITKGWTIGPGGVRIDERQVGDRVQLDVKLPGSHWTFGNHSIRIEVRVPRDLIGDLHTGDGSIHLKGLRGTLRADTGDGSIRGEDLDGTLDAHTGDGSVHIAGRFDKLQLRTQDGSIEADINDGSRLDGDWRLQTGDGSMRLRLPKNLAADLEAHTGDGRITFNVPFTASGAKNDHNMSAKLNGGGPALILRTGDGSITVGNE